MIRRSRQTVLHLIYLLVDKTGQPIIRRAGHLGSRRCWLHLPGRDWCWFVKHYEAPASWTWPSIAYGQHVRASCCDGRYDVTAWLQPMAYHVKIMRAQGKAGVARSAERDQAGDFLEVGSCPRVKPRVAHRRGPALRSSALN